MSVNTYASNFSGDFSTYIAAKTLLVAKKSMVMYGLANKEALPKNSGRTFQYTRYDRIALPQVRLSEGVTPNGSSMAISIVDCVMDQWGDFVSLSDVAIDSVKHPVLQQAIELLGMQAAETVDREIIKVALTGTNIFFPGTVTARGSLTSGSKLSSAAMGKIVAQLRNDGAMPYDGEYFRGVLDPFSEDDMQNDTTFVDAAKYGAIKKLEVGEIGAWKGVRWMRSNTLPALSLLTGESGASSNTVGSLAASTTYNFKVVMVNALTGFETDISAVGSAATGMGKSSIDITIPSLPSGAPAGSTFNVYAGSNGGVLYLHSTGAAAGATVNVGSLPTSGDVAPVTPVTGFKTHILFVLGKQALAIPELNKIQAFLTPKAASDSDPLAQRRKAGWKCDFKPVITNDLFMGRLEHATTNGN